MTPRSAAQFGIASALGPPVPAAAISKKTVEHAVKQVGIELVSLQRADDIVQGIMRCRVSATLSTNDVLFFCDNSILDTVEPKLAGQGPV